MKLAATLTLTLLVVASAANATDKDIEARYSPEFAACLATPEGITDPGMRECLGAEWARQDQVLNAAYRKASGRLNERQKKALQSAQRAWIAFRDASCDALYDDEWGTLSRAEAISCQVDRTIERTIELEKYPPYEGE